MRKLHCQFGQHYYKEKNATSDRIKLQGTRKIGCPAHLNIHTVEVFQDFEIKDAARMGVRKLKERKSAVVQELKSLLAKSNKLKVVKKYFILLPTQEVHHPYHKTSGFFPKNAP